MKTMKYPIKEVNINKIPANRMLSVGITPKQKVLYEKNIRRYGLLTPIVVVENTEGELMTLQGENELEVLKEMDVTNADVFVTYIKNRSDTNKAILLLSSMQKGLNPLSEGLMLLELLKTGEYTQKKLAVSLMKSTSWVCKRLSLAQQLNDDVAQMVLSKQLCPGSAQNISRLPAEVQHEFAMGVYGKSIPKSIVEHLVTAYNSKNTPEAIKQEIITNPILATENIITTKLVKCSKNNKKEALSKFDSSLRLLLRLVSDLEANISSLGKDELAKYSRLLGSVYISLERFIKLIGHYCISPGKSCESHECLEGGASHGSC